MYPMPIDELSGMRVTHLTSGATSTMLATDDATVTWGASPCFGELGLGDKGPKSSAKPDYVHALKGARILGLAMGVAHTLAIVDVDQPASLAVAAAFPVLRVADPAAKPADGKKRKAEPAAAAAAGGGKKKGAK